MADYTASMTDTVALGDSIKQAYEQSFLIANGQDNVMEALCQQRTVIGAKSINMQKFPRNAVDTTALTEKEEPANGTTTDANIAFTPLEYGMNMQTTNLAELQTGGQAGRALVQLVGQDASAKQNLLATAAGLAGAGAEYAVAGAVDGSELVAGNVMSGTFLNAMYNKLARGNVPKINGHYIMVAHDDVINDLREGSAAGTWMDQTKYVDGQAVAGNEIAFYRGFQIVSNSIAALLTGDGGASTVDLYQSLFLGANALGKATSQGVQLRVAPAGDNLGRFTNIGWKGVFNYGVIDSDNIIVGNSSSSVGVNA